MTELAHLLTYLARHRVFLPPRQPFSYHARRQVVRLDLIIERLPKRKGGHPLDWWYRLCDGVAHRPGSPRITALDGREIEQHFYAPKDDPDLKRFERRLWARYGRGWDQFDAVAAHLQAAVNAAYAASWKDLSATERQRADVLWQLMGRAGLVAGEVAALGRAGYVSGANARVRTLLEIAVTGDLLFEAQEETLRHYRADHLMNMRKAAASQAEHSVDLFGDGAQETAEFAKARTEELAEEIAELTADGLIPEKKQRGGTYWWARTELARRGTATTGAVGFDSALAVTALARFKPFYYYFNIPTHAGADALEALLVPRTLDPTEERKVFLTGPTDASPVDAVQVALECLQDLARSAIGSLESAENRTSIDGRLGLLLSVIETAVDTIIIAMHERRPENDTGHPWNKRETSAAHDPPV